MNKKNIIISIIAISILILSLASVSAVEIYGDKTCYDSWLVPGIIPLWICYNPDGGMDHSFLTYEAMYNYYVPPSTEEIIIPETIIVYSDETSTLTVSP